MENQTQGKIVEIVTQYTKLFPEEFDAFKKQNRVKVAMQDNKFSALSNSDTVERLVHEIPETLYAALLTKLEAHELDYFTSKKGAEWFAGKFPPFRASEEV